MSAPTWQYLAGAAAILVIFAALSAVTNHDVTIGRIVMVLLFGVAGLRLGQWLTGRIENEEE